jgi:hypothetical protein
MQRAGVNSGGYISELSASRMEWEDIYRVSIHEKPHIKRFWVTGICVMGVVGVETPFGGSISSLYQAREQRETVSEARFFGWIRSPIPYY